MSTANVEFRRRARDTESNWSTNAECPPHGNARVYELNPRQDVHESTRWSGFDCKADHFTWTHRCDERTCSWSFVAQHDVHSCQACNSRWLSKYPTFNSSWKLVSQWYFTTPCDLWYRFCTQCKEFTDRQIHCNRECVDVCALKMDRQSRGRL